MKIFHNIAPHIAGLMLYLLFSCPGLQAQNRQLVWADEFNDDTIDRSIWQFESATSNDNVQFYTDRSDNAKIVDGVLQIIALKESYEGYEYTSAHIRTEHLQYWRYGRIEASIRVPGTSGFVPAFWMLPEDYMYGWWPLSGEIDIMEHPSNEITSIYGTVHTEKYNLFSGSLPPQGGEIDIPDAETAFHIYSVEWNQDRIDFFIDEQKYYSFENDNGGCDTWPFDHPFYIILNLAVGGGWVGLPDENTIFPAIMEIDYVRVYQEADEISIKGADFVTFQEKGVNYSIGEMEGATCQWSVPGDAEIISGQGTSQATINWGVFGGDISAELTTGTGTFLKTLSVRVTPNYLKNPGFEKGIKFWNKSAGYPAKANFNLSTESFHLGNQSLHVEVIVSEGNPWDIQLAQKDLMLLGGTTYHVAFWAKAEGNIGEISAAIINQNDYSLIAIKNFTPSTDWTLYEFDFTAVSSIHSAFNIDLGGKTGNYYFDDFILNTQQLNDLNQLNNPDFCENNTGWDLITLSNAEATGTVEKGEYKVTITNAGINPWDIYFGQNGLVIENGIKYRISFDVYSDMQRQISALVGKNSEPWTVYSGQQLISVTTAKQTYTFTFIMTEPTDLQARLGFDIGDNGNNLYFDNILLEKLGPINTSTNAPISFSESLSLLQTSPNPFKLETTFSYELNEPVFITLRIFNLSGQEIRTILSEYQYKGNHQVLWKADGLSAGIYFYRFEAGDRSETGKLILLH